MIGKRKPPRRTAGFDVGNVYPLSLKPRPFHSQLAQAAPRLFNDEDFAAFYSDRMGRPSVPPQSCGADVVVAGRSARLGRGGH